ncbi:SAP domain-containing ribonucleoprotein-like [Littorina saxatilis]|uniref:SAP domain-containing protein n=1 Tax=Littorina saxatilis TaxID=31220 RepID=A0AAN9BNF8_9CAEN
MATISMEELKKMKVADLKKELKDKGLATTGTKDILLERLEQSLEVEGTEAGSNEVDNVEKSIDQLVGDTAPKVAAVAAAPAVAAPKEDVTKTEIVFDLKKDDQKKAVSLKELPDADKLKARAEKFGGAVSDTAKKLVRAERFGLPTPATATAGSGKIASTPATAEDLDKMKKRAERFGAVVSNKLSKVDEDEKKRKRLERFGNTLSSSAPEPKKVKLNSTDKETDEKKNKRAERFGLT